MLIESILLKNGINNQPILTFARLRNWLGRLRSFFSAANYSFTEGNLFRGVLLLGIPMACELAMEGGFALVDIFFVSWLGQDAVATVGLTECFVSVIIAISVGLGTAAAIVVARRIGEQDRQRASSAAMLALTLGVCISLPIALCAAFSEPLASPTSSQATPTPIFCLGCRPPLPGSIPYSE